MTTGMTPVATPFFFYMLSGLAIGGGLLVITRRNAVHSALALIVTLLAVAGLYLMLYAPFVAEMCIRDRPSTTRSNTGRSTNRREPAQQHCP